MLSGLLNPIPITTSLPGSTQLPLSIAVDFTYHEKSRPPSRQQEFLEVIESMRKTFDLGKKKEERVMGFEPTTTTLATLCSAS